jgi:hypothetical protein
MSIVGPSPTPKRAMGRVNWNAVAVVVALVVALAGWFRDDSKDNEARRSALDARITVLETQRANDALRMERIESKLDRLLERTK